MRQDTILRMIAGHETPISGEVRIDGENVVGLPPVRRGTAMMFQDYALFPHLSCLDNVAFSLKMSGAAKAERRERARRVLARVQMAQFADRVPGQLSGGQKQRIALARALITRVRSWAGSIVTLGAVSNCQAEGLSFPSLVDSSCIAMPSAMSVLVITTRSATAACFTDSIWCSRFAKPFKASTVATTLPRRKW